MPIPLPPFSVFLKPWPGPLSAIAPRVKAWGFDGVELPVRPGFPVTPENVETELPQAARLLREHGLEIFSVAGDLTEPVFAACAAAGVPLVRVCVRIPEGRNYLDFEAETKRSYEGLLPLLEKHRIAIGIQNHCDRWVANASALRRLIEPFPPERIAAVWDAAHNALNGEVEDLALDLVWSHLRMVNLKNAYWHRRNPGGTMAAQWEVRWTSGRLGLASWARVAAELARRRWQGPICLTAEYSNEAAVDRLIAEDIGFARELFTQEYHHVS